MFTQTQNNIHQQMQFNTQQMHRNAQQMQWNAQQMHRNVQSMPSTAYTWQKYTGRVPQNAVHTSKNYVVIRAYHANDWMTGKLNLKDRRAYVAHDSKEVHVTSSIEVLVAAPGHIVEWVPASHGQVPQGAVGPVGKDNLFVGRAVCPRPENVYTPGKIHPSHGSLYVPFGGQEVPYQTYEACVIRPGDASSQWQKFTGRVPPKAVLASKQYAVIRVQHAGQWVPGKLNTRTLKAYAAYDMKEVEVRNADVEVLIQTSGMEAQWVPASNGTVPQGAVGPFGADGVYIGRAVCPLPENVLTPGKIHPSHQCLYIPFDGKELNCKQYEALVMVPIKNWKIRVLKGIIEALTEK